MIRTPIRKQIWWMGDSRQRLREFPEEARWEIGGALDNAQLGDPHSSASPMRGVNAVEIVADFDTDAYRCVYTTKYKGHVYVLHAFKKKSKKGSKTPQPDIALIKDRLKKAGSHFKALDDDRQQRRLIN